MSDFGFDDDDFGLDTGIDLDSEITSNASDSYDEAPPPVDNNGGLSFDNNEESSPKKVAIIAIIIGIVILTIVLLIFSISNHFKEKNQSEIVNSNTLQQSVNDIEGNKVYEGQNQYQSEQNNIDAEINQDDTSDEIPEIDASNNWVEFGLAGDISFDEEYSGEFTVTNIQHFAKVVNKNNDKIVKSIVTGNISGLVGTYEVEIPYYKAVKLQPGTLLKIQYKYGVQNGVKVIGEIIFV